MAYIGVQPTDTYLSIASQQITGTGSATYTLDYSVSTEEDVAVFVNNVRQNVSSYTVSGDQLTLGGTISASDECWVLFLGRTVGTKTPAVGSVTNDMLAGSIANSKLANSSITLNGSAVSLGGSATVGGENTPAFGAYLASTQTISSGVNTKINFNGEAFDTDSAFDNSTNYRFTVPTGKGGKYLFFLTIQGNIETNFHANFAINGSNTNLSRDYNLNYIASGGVVNIALLSLSAGDYVEGYCQQNSGGNQDINANRTRFSGYKLIGA